MEEAIQGFPPSKQIRLQYYLAASIAFICLANLILLGFAREKFPLETSLLAAFLCLDSYLALFILLGHGSVQLFLQQHARRHNRFVLLFLLALFIPYLVYAFGTRSFSSLSTLKLLLYIALPTFVCSTTRTPSGYSKWQDAAAVLLLWLPIDFRLLRDVWPWPHGLMAYSLNSLAATSLGVFLFVGVRNLDQVGYQFHFSLEDWGVALRNFLLFAPLAIIIGFVTGFISIAERFATPWELAVSAIGIFVLIAIPEELLFRGIIQNLMSRVIPSSFWSLLLSSLLFGASHLNNGPGLDWRYFLLATIAGLFYGDAYRMTRKLISPAILHALVDVTWRGFFR